MLFFEFSSELFTKTPFGSPVVMRSPTHYMPIHLDFLDSDLMLHEGRRYPRKQSSGYSLMYRKRGDIIVGDVNWCVLVRAGIKEFYSCIPCDGGYKVFDHLNGKMSKFKKGLLSKHVGGLHVKLDYLDLFKPEFHEGVKKLLSAVKQPLHLHDTIIHFHHVVKGSNDVISFPEVNFISKETSEITHSDDGCQIDVIIENAKSYSIGEYFYVPVLVSSSPNSNVNLLNLVCGGEMKSCKTFNDIPFKKIVKNILNIGSIKRPSIETETTTIVSKDELHAHNQPFENHSPLKSSHSFRTSWAV